MVSALTVNVQGVDAESGALTTRPQDGDQEVQDEGAFENASRTRTPWAAFLTGRTPQKFTARALCSRDEALIESGGGTGPLKPRQPIRSVPMPDR